MGSEMCIRDSDPEDVDPFDTSSQLDNFPIPDDVNSINENFHENPDTSSPINLTGGAAGSENSEGDQDDNEQSGSASEYDGETDGTSTVGVGEGEITNNNSNEPALRRSARLLARTVLPDYTT